VFTGIVEAVGRIEAIRGSGRDARYRIGAGGLPLADVVVGDSIAVNGCCLTVVALHDASFEVDLSPETLAVTLLGEAAPGTVVNLEKALRVGDRLGGHFVSGHVDGVATVLVWERQERSVHALIAPPRALMRYIAVKGSVCIDGVSLTVNSLGDAHFGLQLIPHTLAVTTLGGFTSGRRCHIEVDLIARYLERLQAAAWPGEDPLPA
jgi:riboflavin synthase